MILKHEKGKINPNLICGSQQTINSKAETNIYEKGSKQKRKI